MLGRLYAAMWGLELVESYFEDHAFLRTEWGAQWCDSAMIGRKPCFASEEHQSEFYDRLATIVKTLPESSVMPLSGDVRGPCFRRYEQLSSTTVWASLRRRLSPRGVLRRVFSQLIRALSCGAEATSGGHLA